MNRRDFLHLNDLAAAPISHRSLPGDPLEPWQPSTGDVWDYRMAAHLLRRTLVGPTEVEIRRAVDEGLESTLTRLYAAHEPDASELEFVGEDPRTDYGFTPDQSEWWDIFNRYREWMHHLTRWYMKTLIGPTTSMQEKMTFFWHSHFTMELDGVAWPEYMYEAIATLRRNCFGNVRELAWMITIDMGMLQYLDGWFNRSYATWSQINENYARELLELFTMGLYDRDGTPNYTQADVMAAARSLTGWTFSPSSLGPRYSGLRSRFLEEAWDPTEKTFLGKTGAWKARDIIDIIFAERAEQVSRNISAKLYRFIVHDDVDDEVVDAMARIMRENDWEIMPVLDALLRSRHFLSREMHGGMPRPLADFYLGTIRTLGVVDVPDFRPDITEQTGSDLYVRLRKLGQLPLNPPNVNSWPTGRRWLSASTIPERILWASGVAAGSLRDRFDAPAYTLDPLRFAREFADADDPRALVAGIARLMLPAEIAESELASFVDVLLDGGPDYEWSLDDPEQNAAARIRKLLAAIARHPTFQLT